MWQKFDSANVNFLVKCAEVQLCALSRYQHTHKKLAPQEYRPMSMHGNTMHQQDEGGFWIEKASLPGPPKQFSAKSTYQADILDGSNTAAKAYQKTESMSITTCPFAEGTRRAGQDFTMSSSRPIRTAPAALQTQNGDMIGYTTMYKSMVLKDPLTGGSAAPGGPRVPSQEPATRARVGSCPSSSCLVLISAHMCFASAPSHHLMAHTCIPRCPLWDNLNTILCMLYFFKGLSTCGFPGCKCLYTLCRQHPLSNMLPNTYSGSATLCTITLGEGLYLHNELWHLWA